MNIFINSPLEQFEFLSNCSFLTIIKLIFILFLFIINIFVIIKELEINKFSKYQPKYLAAGFLDSSVVRALKVAGAATLGALGVTSGILTIQNEYIKYKNKEAVNEEINKAISNSQQALEEVRDFKIKWACSLDLFNSQFKGLNTEITSLKTEVQSLK